MVKKEAGCLLKLMMKKVCANFKITLIISIIYCMSTTIYSLPVVGDALTKQKLILCARTYLKKKLLNHCRTHCIVYK